MARKSNDLYSLLHSRGRGRSSRRGGLLSDITGFFGALIPSSLRGRDMPRPRRGAMQLSGPMLAGIVFACLGVGYLVGDAFPLRAGSRDLNVQAKGRPEGQQPGPIRSSGDMAADEECRKLGNRALLVSFYDGDHRTDSAAMARFLRTQGLDKARIFQVWLDGKPYWESLVYCADDAEADLARRHLQAVKFPEDLGIEAFKNRREGWPWPTSVE